MIQIKELSVGNWVKFPHGIDKIIDLPYVEGKGVCASFAASATLFPVSVEDLEPIGITPEILEKNGWRVVAGNQILSPWIAVWEKDECSCVLFHNSKKASITINNNTTNDNIIDVTYIHQLQNALTLCGVDKNIEL